MSRPEAFAMTFVFSRLFALRATEQSLSSSQLVVRINDINAA